MLAPLALHPCVQWPSKASCPRATQQIICSNEAGILCLSLLVMGTTLFMSASESHAGSP